MTLLVGLLTDRINNKLEKSNLINEHALNREPVPLRNNSSGLQITVGHQTLADQNLPVSDESHLCLDIMSVETFDRKSFYSKEE